MRGSADRQDATRPPSRNPTGRRLNKLTIRPHCASAKQSCDPVARPIPSGTSAPAEPRAGPAKLMRQSSNLGQSVFETVVVPL